MSSASQISAAFFGPQTESADAQYLTDLHHFLSQHDQGKTLLKHVADLVDDTLWNIFASVRQDVRDLTHGPECLKILSDWALSGTSGPLSRVRSNIVLLPLLAVIQIGQYLRYLESLQIGHSDFVRGLRDGSGGGVHGYCGGLPAAISVACARDEHELVGVAAIAMKLLVGIGAYTEAADSERGAGSTLLAVRLKHEHQGREIIRRFPDAYISGVTAPRSVSIGGPSSAIEKVRRYVVEDLGLHAQRIDLSGSAHNPANTALADELCRVCRRAEGLQLPEASRLQVPLRSNQNGQTLQGNMSLTDDLILAMLAAPCDWLKLITSVASDLERTNKRDHTICVFGWTDCITMGPFYAEKLRINKILAKDCVSNRHREALSLSGPSVLQLPQDTDTQDLSQGSRIAIVGASCRLPGADSMGELWHLLCRGANTCVELPHGRLGIDETCFRMSQAGSFFENRKMYGNFIQDVKRFDEAFFGISAREAANMDPQQRMALELSFEALEDAGYFSTHQRESLDNVGCFIGCVSAEYMENTNSHAPTAYTSTGTVPAFICGRVSHVYGWSGPSEMINTACSSSIVAINRACKAIQGGECRMALAGGVNVITGINSYLDLARAGFLSPTGQCKPFDESADGYCRAEGAGLVVLKKLSDALTDGDAIWGVIAGVATNQGGLSATLTTPYPPSQKALYQEVLRQSGLKADQVTYVEMHGTGTQVGDPLEMESVRSVFGGQNRSQMLHIGSIKANIGHAEPTAGVAGLLKVLLMMHHSTIPPQVGFKSLNPKIPELETDNLIINTDPMPWNARLKAALVNSYGAAGSNGALLCCQPPKGTARQRDEAVVDGTIRTRIPLFITGKTNQSLEMTAQALGRYLEASEELPLLAVASRLQRNTQQLGFYATVHASTVREAAANLKSVRISGMMPLPGLADSRPLILAFSGQTSSIIGLPKSIYDTVPSFRFYIDQVDVEFKMTMQSPNSLLDVLFNAEPVTDIPALHCGIFAIQFAAARCWIDSGATPKAAIGHSLGELTALAITGILSLSDTVKLVVGRAKLIETRWGSDKGSMLALEATCGEFEDIKSLIPDAKLHIACYNGPRSLVVSGCSHSIERLQHILTTDARRFRCTRLKTSHGFHSNLVEPITTDLAIMSRTLAWNPPKIPLFTCTQRPLPSGTYAQSPSAHARDPVYFAEAVRRIESQHGKCLWLEAGFDTPIMSMIDKASGNPGAHVLQSVSTRGQSPAETAISNTCNALWKAGQRGVHHWSLLVAQPPGRNSGQGVVKRTRPAWLPPYQFVRKPHWISHIDRASEKQQLLENSKAASSATNGLSGSRGPPPLLVEQSPQPGQSALLTEFAVNTSHPRFQKIATGHAVCGHPLTPMPMYMELATSALLQILGLSEGELKAATLQFNAIEIHSPLGVEPQGQIRLRLQQTAGRRAWQFGVVCIHDMNRPLESLIVRGHVSLTDESSLSGVERLVTGRLEKLASSDDTEIIHSDRLYKLFARVVDYGGFYKGIKTIRVRDSEASSSVQLPQDDSYQDQNMAQAFCDAIALDVCIHSVGFLINTSSAMATHEICILNGLEQATMSPQFGPRMQSPLKVYTSFASADAGADLTGDVYVCTQENKLLATFSGVRMHTLPLDSLTRILDNAFKSRGKQPRRTAFFRSSVDGLAHQPTAPTRIAFKDPQDGTTSAILKSLVADCTLVSVEDIPDNKPLGFIGLDSLGALELADEILSKFDRVISSHELVEMTFSALEQSLIQVVPVHERMPAAEEMIAATSAGVRGERNSLQSCSVILKELIAECTMVDVSDVPSGKELGVIGLDSLGASELAEELFSNFNINVVAKELLELTLDDIQNLVTADASSENRTASSVKAAEVKMPSILFDNKTSWDSSYLAAEPVKHEVQIEPNIIPEQILLREDPFLILDSMTSEFDESAVTYHAAGYWTGIAPLQDQITICYIVEAFSQLGEDLGILSSGLQVGKIPYVSPKYDKLMTRCWETLQKHGIVLVTPTGVIRGDRPVPAHRGSDLLQELKMRFPAYREEALLLELTGPRLGDCLSGKIDSVALMFGNSQSLKIMEDYYALSPISRTVIDQLVTFLIRITSVDGGPLDRPVRILEVGGGTGGTTRWLVEGLGNAGIQYEYTFTDISPSLVRKAKQRFEKTVPKMRYATFNLESRVDAEFRGKFDFVLATNTIHATEDRVATCQRLRETLAPTGGLLVLAELTHHISWADICFGLLDGWWLADGPIAPLMTAQEWMSTFSEAGFKSTGYSQGTSADANTAQLLVSSNVPWGSDFPSRAPEARGDATNGQTGRRTFAYKEVDGVVINADVYFPQRAPASAMPVGLMIHGGGFMTLSRRAVRPEQTQHLLAKGVLPVSVDYRLCPEISIIDGPITDVRDAYLWIRTLLPAISEQHGVTVDVSNIVVIGWSTGGHLAMTLAWTLRALQIPPPKGILSFYGPIELEGPDAESTGFRHLPGPSRKLDQILNALPEKPMTNSRSSAETSALGWMVEGGDRSDLLLKLSQEGLMLPALFNGLSGKVGDRVLDVKPPSASRIALSSPTCRLRAGEYNVPTCIVHGTADEIAPHAAAEKFHAMLQESGVRSRFISLLHAEHVFDVNIKRGTTQWDTMIGPGYDFLLSNIL